MTVFTPQLKHHILNQYQEGVRGCGFNALATRYAVGGGGTLIRSWYLRWDGTPESLQRKKGSGRKAPLTAAQIQRHIVTPVRAANRAHQAIHYPEIRRKIHTATGRCLPLRTVQRLGQQAACKRHTNKKMSHKEGQRPAFCIRLHANGCADTPSCAVSKSHCQAIAAARSRIRRIGVNNTLFLDETHLRVSAAERDTIVAPGEQAIVVVEDTTAYAKRYDMIACCTPKEVLPPIVWSPSERAQMGCKGINKQMLLRYIHDILGPACGALDRYPLYLALDRASIHNTDDILAAFHEAGCQEMVEIIKLPAQAAKRMSPLDNSLFHSWKEACRKRSYISERNIEQIMCDEWNRIPSALLSSFYKRCRLSGRKGVYSDCPAPAAHQHGQ